MYLETGQPSIKSPAIMMADFHFHGQRLDNSLVASTSQLLDAAGVPSLLWGNYLLTVYGVPTFVDVDLLLGRPF